MGEARIDASMWAVRPQPKPRTIGDQPRTFNPLRIYTACVSTVGLGILIWSLANTPLLSFEVLLLIALVILAELTTSEAIAPQIAFTMSSAVHFAALLLFGVPLAALVAMIGGLAATLVHDASRRLQGRPSQFSTLQRAPFNMAALGLAIVAAGQVYILCGGQVGEIARVSNLLPMILAAVATEAANAVVVIKAVSLQTNRPVLQIWRENISWALPIQLLSMVVGGGGLALGYQIAGPVGVGVFFLPIVLTIYAFKLYVRHSKNQMAHLEEIIKERTDYLSRTNQELREADRVKTRFFSVINHEMRSPLHSILGYTELLMASDPLSPDQKLMLRSATDSGRRLLDLVSNILDFSRLQDSKLDIVPKTVGVLPAVNEALSTVSPMAEQRHSSITVDIPATTPDLWANPRRVVQILVNLLSNAVKYTSDGGCITVTAQRSPTDSMLEISVTDDGMGIQADQLPHVFDCFSRIERPEVRRTVGTGLGLYIADGLVRAHGGRIRVRSQEGRGSCFTFTLPIANGHVAESLPSQVAWRVPI